MGFFNNFWRRGGKEKFQPRMVCLDTPPQRPLPRTDNSPSPPLRRDSSIFKFEFSPSDLRSHSGFMDTQGRTGKKSAVSFLKFWEPREKKQGFQPYIVSLETPPRPPRSNKFQFSEFESTLSEFVNHRKECQDTAFSKKKKKKKKGKIIPIEGSPNKPESPKSQKSKVSVPQRQKRREMRTRWDGSHDGCEPLQAARSKKERKKYFNRLSNRLFGWKRQGRKHPPTTVIRSVSPASGVDESLQERVQSAILYCKRSYNSSKASYKRSGALRLLHVGRAGVAAYLRFTEVAAVQDRRVFGE